MRTATIADFKKGTILIDKDDQRIKTTLKERTQDGIWSGSHPRGEKTVFECEASGYFLG